jgi:hypothetical protein
MIERLLNLDRRWIYLAMLLAVGVPVLLQPVFPEQPTPLVQRVFDAIEDLPSGSKVLLVFDYDPTGEGEIGPMATSFVRHCAERGHKMYFLSLWPVGPQMIDERINRILRPNYPHLQYGRDYVNIGYKDGREAVIKVIVTNLKESFPTDQRGTSLNQIPMTKDIRSVQDMDLILDISSGYPGTKEWVQYAATPYRVPLAAGVTGVQAPLFYPYLDRAPPAAGNKPAPKPAAAGAGRASGGQLLGLLGGVKGAAEYEAALAAAYPQFSGPEYSEARRRMGPQLVAHLLMIGLIVAGNVLYFLSRKR